MKVSNKITILLTSFMFISLLNGSSEKERTTEAIKAAAIFKNFDSSVQKYPLKPVKDDDSLRSPQELANNFTQFRQLFEAMVNIDTQGTITIKGEDKGKQISVNLSKLVRETTVEKPLRYIVINGYVNLMRNLGPLTVGNLPRFEYYTQEIDQDALNPYRNNLVRDIEIIGDRFDKLDKLFKILKTGPNAGKELVRPPAYKLTVESDSYQDIGKLAALMPKLAEGGKFLDEFVKLSKEKKETDLDNLINPLWNEAEKEWTSKGGVGSAGLRDYWMAQKVS